MALRWYYSVDASTVLEITDRVRTPGPDGEGGIVVGHHAEEGSGWEGSINVDDELGDFVPLMHRRIYAVEDSAPAGSQVVFNGFISNLDVIRGTPPVEASRIWTITLSDPNSLLARRIFVGSSAFRPAETDIQRILWMLGETELNTLSPDLTYIDQTGPVNMDAAPDPGFTGQKPESVLSDCSQQSGKNYFVKYEEAAAVGGALVSSSVANPTVITTTSAHGFITGMQVSIAGHTGSTPSLNGIHTVTVTGANTFTIPVNVTVGGTGGTTSTVGRFVLCYFNANTSDLMPSTISLSNVESEIDETTVFAISDDTRLSRAGGRSPVSGMFGTFPGGYSYIQDTAIGDLYVYRDVSAPSINVKTQAIADARTARQLAELDEPDDEVEAEINVDEAQVNLAMAGMSIPLHATHLPNYTEDDDAPGYAATALMRIMRRQVRQLSPERFGVRMWMTPMTGTEYGQAVLYSPSGGGPPGGGALWTSTGDAPPSPRPVFAKIGPIDYYEDSPGVWNGFIFSANGTVTVTFNDSLFSILFPGDPGTFTWRITHINGPDFTTGTDYAIDGITADHLIAPEWEIAATFDVLSGDRVAGIIFGDKPFGVPGGIAPNPFLRVTGIFST